MVVRVQGERWKIVLKAVSWLHSLRFTKLTATEQIFLCVKERNFWFELPFILFYRFDLRNWDIKGRYWGGCCRVWSCFKFNLKHPPIKKKCHIYERRNTKYWQICFDPWKLSRSTKYSVWESTVRLHWKKYEQGLTSSAKVKRGRPLLLGLEIDENVMK